MAIESRFRLILFDDGPQIVPTVWITPKKKHIFWPKLTSMAGYYRSVENEKSPEATWEREIIMKDLGGSDTFQRGLEKLKAYEDESDINTDPDAKDKRKFKKCKTQDNINFMYTTTTLKKKPQKKEDRSKSNENQSIKLPRFPCPPLKSQKRLTFNESVPEGILNQNMTSNLSCRNVSDKESSIHPELQSSSVSGSSCTAVKNLLSHHQRYEKEKQFFSGEAADRKSLRIDNSKKNSLPASLGTTKLRVSTGKQTQKFASDEIIACSGEKYDESKISPLLSANEEKRRSTFRYSSSKNNDDEFLTPPNASGHSKILSRQIENDRNLPFLSDTDLTPRNNYGKRNNYESLENMRKNPRKKTEDVYNEDYTSQKYVMRSLAEIKLHFNMLKEQLDGIEEKQDEVLRILKEMPNNYRNPNQDDTQEILYAEFKALFPIKNLDELQQLENNLLNANYQAELVAFLKKIGGKNTKEVVSFLMYKVFTNEIGSHFSWMGNKGKFIFSALNISQVILETLRANRKVSTENDAIERIKIWLQHAPERYVREAEKHQRFEMLTLAENELYNSNEEINSADEENPESYHNDEGHNEGQGDHNQTDENGHDSLREDTRHSDQNDDRHNPQQDPLAIHLGDDTGHESEDEMR